MRVEVHIPASETDGLANFIEQSISRVRPAVNQAMAERFIELVHGNMGFAGADRPMAWAPLSPNYARKVGREVATLILTGALKDSIRSGGFEGDSVEVSVSDADVPYASIHQSGGTRMPKRPYFPIDDSGQVLPWSASQVAEAAQKAIEQEAFK
jgi:phage gpG-like protein